MNLLNLFLIKIKKDFIDVKNVEVKETSDATDEFEYLDIKYGTIEEELGERMGVGILYIGATTDEVRKTTDEVRKVGDKVDNVGKQVKHVGDKVEESKNEITHHIDQSRDQMIKHIDGNFNTLDEKYHTVSETLISLNKNLVASQELLKEVVSNLTTIVSEFVENKKMLSKKNDD